MQLNLWSNKANKKICNSWIQQQISFADITVDMFRLSQILSSRNRSSSLVLPPLHEQSDHHFYWAYSSVTHQQHETRKENRKIMRNETCRTCKHKTSPKVREVMSCPDDLVTVAAAQLCYYVLRTQSNNFPFYFYCPFFTRIGHTARAFKVAKGSVLISKQQLLSLHLTPAI